MLLAIAGRALAQGEFGAQFDVHATYRVPPAPADTPSHSAASPQCTSDVVGLKIRKIFFAHFFAQVVPEVPD